MSKEQDSYNQISQENNSCEKSKIELDRLTTDNFPLDRYLPVELLGKGAAGNVFFCKDKVLSNRKVAVKVAHGILSSQAFEYQREAKATSKLNHSNIIKIYDCGITNDGIPYISMEYINGEPLEDYLAKEKFMEPLIAIPVFLKVCDALSYAHSQGVFHRDLKPSNILLVPIENERDIKIIDFGIAYISQLKNDPTVIQGKTIAGTPLYMSPDQLNNLTYDACSEIYSLGCIIFETLTGTPPYVADSSLELFSAHANLEIPKLGSRLKDVIFSLELEDFVSTCMAKEKSDRFQSIDEVKQSLNDLLDQYCAKKTANINAPKTVSSSAPKHKTKKYNKRNIALLMVILIASFAGLFTIIISNNDISEFYDSKNRVDTIEVEEKKLPSSIDEFSKGRNNKNWYTGTNEQGELCIFAKQGSNDKDVEDLAFRDPLKIGRVCIPYTSQITGVGFKRLKNHPIFLVNTKSKSLTNEGLKSICELKYLTVLVLSDSGKVSEEGFKHLLKAPKLKYLYIVNHKFTPNTISILSKIIALRQLGLFRGEYEDLNSLEKLNRLSSLDKLSITACNLEYIGFLKDMVHLKDLSFAYTQIGDEELKYLVNMNLKNLDIKNTKITAQGLVQINKIKSLENLTVSLDNGITRDAIRNRIKLPNCVINIHHK